MSDDFRVIDLVSQSGAIRKLLAGKTDSEKLRWLSEHGELEILTTEYLDEKQSYRFTSALGQQAVFFFEAGDFMFVGGHKCGPADL
jgi:hypothetical protein